MRRHGPASAARPSRRHPPQSPCSPPCGEAPSDSDGDLEGPRPARPCFKHGSASCTGLRSCRGQCRSAGRGYAADVDRRMDARIAERIIRSSAPLGAATRSPSGRGCATPAARSSSTRTCTPGPTAWSQRNPETASSADEGDPAFEIVDLVSFGGFAAAGTSDGGIDVRRQVGAYGRDARDVASRAWIASMSCSVVGIPAIPVGVK